MSGVKSQEGAFVLGLSSTFYNTASSSTVCPKMLGLNPGLLRLRHRQSDAQTTRLWIRSHPQTWLELIQIRLDLIHCRTRLDLIHLDISNKIRCNKKLTFLRQEKDLISPCSMTKNNRSIMFYFLY